MKATNISFAHHVILLSMNLFAVPPLVILADDTAEGPQAGLHRLPGAVPEIQIGPKAPTNLPHAPLFPVSIEQRHAVATGQDDTDRWLETPDASASSALWPGFHQTSNGFLVNDRFHVARRTMGSAVSAARVERNMRR
jgi:hypothetical protein